MSIQEFAKVLRKRWLTVCVTIAAAILGAVAVNLLTPPVYEAETRLFVSTTSGSSLGEIYQGNRFSQERVLSYTQILMGETLAQRTIDKLGLPYRADDLRERVDATLKPDTVLIQVSVRDESAVRVPDIANALSDEFVLMMRQLETPEDGTRPDARVVVEQRASIPDKPVSPQSTRNLAFGLLLGVALGIGFAFAHDLLDNTVTDRENLEEITGVGVVGIIPYDKKRSQEPAISFESDNSPIAEAFRKLRTNLQFLAVDNPPRVIVVASSMPAEGKTTTAINLALALAEAEHTVALVDGDLRRPQLDKYLDLVGSVGFSTLLANQATIAEVLQKTRFPGITVLTSGSVPPNPSELLGSQAAKKTLAELRAHFDYVVVDSSPLLAVTDAAVLAAAADGVLIMARYGETKRDRLNQAVANLESVSAPLLGAVMTMAPARGGASYSYRYNYYGGDARTSASSTAASSDAGWKRLGRRRDDRNRDDRSRSASDPSSRAGF
ncbi:MAG: lipopolysaccharide biosynthesis [Mycobacterium sp.]|nr:lipopolysaccharide biosynthesis [Mycobacterium sp.]